MTILETTRRQTMMSIALICLGYAAFNIGDAMIKVLHRFHFSQLVAINSGIIIILMTCYGLYKGRGSFKMRNPRLIALRGVFSAVTGICNIIALPHITLTTFYTLIFTCPFWVAIFSSVFLDEKMNARRMSVIIAGFAIVLYIFQPGTGLWSLWSGLVLVGACSFSAGATVMRHLGAKESRVSIIIAGSATSFCLMLPFLPGHFMMPTFNEAMIFLLMGTTGAIGILSVAYAFQTAPSAATVAPYHYTQIVWGALLGYVLFGDVPEHRVMVGALLIIAAGLYLLYGETRPKKQIEAGAKAELP